MRAHSLEERGHRNLEEFGKGVFTEADARDWGLKAQTVAPRADHRGGRDGRRWWIVAGASTQGALILACRERKISRDQSIGLTLRYASEEDCQRFVNLGFRSNARSLERALIGQQDQLR